MSRYQGKYAVVTGSGGGIGAAIAERFLKGGLKVIGMDIRKKHKVRHNNYIPMKTDMSSKDCILKCFKEVDDKYGPMHVLVNNAGILHANTFARGNVEKWRQTVQINIIGLCIASRQAVKVMQENCIDGHIVQMCSILGHFIPKQSSEMYTASKHAVRALAETLRLELAAEGSNIKICSMCPGIVETEIFTANNFLNSKAKRQGFDKTPKLCPENIADGVWYMIDQPTNVNVCTAIIRPLWERL